MRGSIIVALLMTIVWSEKWENHESCDKPWMQCRDPGFYGRDNDDVVIPRNILKGPPNEDPKWIAYLDPEYSIKASKGILLEHPKESIAIGRNAHISDDYQIILGANSWAKDTLHSLGLSIHEDSVGSHWVGLTVTPSGDKERSSRRQIEAYEAIFSRFKTVDEVLQLTLKSAHMQFFYGVKQQMVNLPKEKPHPGFRFLVANEGGAVIAFYADGAGIVAMIGPGKWGYLVFNGEYWSFLGN